VTVTSRGLRVRWVNVGGPAFNDGARARVGVLKYQLEVVQARDRRDNVKA
jgi:hypothetical protein